MERDVPALIVHISDGASCTSFVAADAGWPTFYNAF